MECARPQQNLKFNFAAIKDKGAYKKCYKADKVYSASRCYFGIDGRHSLALDSSSSFVLASVLHRTLLLPFLPFLFNRCARSEKFFFFTSQRNMRVCPAISRWLTGPRAHTASAGRWWCDFSRGLRIGEVPLVFSAGRAISKQSAIFLYASCSTFFSVRRNQKK